MYISLRSVYRYGRSVCGCVVASVTDEGRKEEERRDHTGKYVHASLRLPVLIRIIKGYLFSAYLLQVTAQSAL